MAKKRGNKVPVGQLTDAQQKAFEAQLLLQQRALEMAQAQADRAYEANLQELANRRAEAEAARQAEIEDATRAAQYQGLQDVADIYGRRAGEVGQQYDVYGTQVQQQREAALRALADAIGRGQTGISSAQEQLLKDLVAPTAYQNVPLVELGQIQNPLLAGLQAEGASAAGVEAQSAQDAAMAAQLAAMTRGAMGQLNVGEQNYLNALRNAGAFAAAQARQELETRGALTGQDMRSEYDKLAQQIAQQRLADIGDLEVRRAEALAQRGEFAPIDRSALPAAPQQPNFDYAAALEKARREAMRSIRSALPSAGTGTTGTTGTNPYSETAGRFSGTGAIYVPFQNVPKDYKFSVGQLKRKREQEDLAALRQRGL